MCGLAPSPQLLAQSGQTGLWAYLTGFGSYQGQHFRASFSYSPYYPAVGQSVQFTDTSTGGPTTWRWDFGDGTTSTVRNPRHSFTSTGFHRVDLAVGNGSYSLQTRRMVLVVSSGASLKASFSYSPASPVIGQNIQFTDSSTGNPTSWQWSFGDGTSGTVRNPTHSFAAAGAYTVTLTASNSSGSSKASQAITVKATITASFTFSPSAPAAGQAVQFADKSSGSPTAWQWSFGDGGSSTAQNPTHTFASAGPYTVTLAVTNASGSSNTNQVVTVVPGSTLTASFTYSPSSPAEGKAVQFTDTSSGSPTAWQWSFGDGGSSTVQNPGHTFASVGSYTVTLTVTNSTGSDQATQSVTVGTTSNSISEDRLIDWSEAGVFANGVKGIPDYPVAVNAKNAPYNATGDGTTDDTAAIKSAIAACPAGSAVLLPQGTYRLSGTLTINKGMVVRGEGPDKTKLIQSASGHIFRISGSGASAVTDVASGFTKGSDTITVANAGSFKAGDIVDIDELNDPSLVNPTGVGTCTWCGRYGASGGRAMGETKLIRSISGNTITFTRSLHFTYKAEFSPQLVRLSGSPVRNAGIELLDMEFNPGTSDGHCVFMSNAAYCWIKGVESSNPPKKHVELQSGAYSCEVRDSYFHDAQYFTSDRGYGINISLMSSDNLVENNILYHLHYAVALEASGAGNVIAYNYQERTSHYQADWFIQSMGTHGAQTYMNLWEGNVAGMIDFDDYWGSGSHQMVIRNHFTRQNPGENVSSNIIAAIVDAQNYYDTFIGNILGTPGCAGVVEQNPYRSSYNNPVIWKIGYRCCSATGTPSDPVTAQTLIRHGNFDYVTNAITWDSSIADHTIPDSLYLPAKPAWFGALTWPPFTPDRAGFNPSNLNKLPAQVHYETGPKVGQPFNPNYK
jgi:PKD repeat protein